MPIAYGDLASRSRARPRSRTRNIRKLNSLLGLGLAHVNSVVLLLSFVDRGQLLLRLYEGNDIR